MKFLPNMLSIKIAEHDIINREFLYDVRKIQILFVSKGDQPCINTHVHLDVPNLRKI